MVLRNDTKYTVAQALVDLTREHLVEKLQAQEVDLQEVLITRVDRLLFSIRIKPRSGTAPRYIYVKVSEPQ